MQLPKFWLIGARCDALSLRAGRAAQEAYPSRLITIVVPITPGTTIDILARLYADKLVEAVRPAGGRRQSCRAPAA